MNTGHNSQYWTTPIYTPQPSHIHYQAHSQWQDEWQHPNNFDSHGIFDSHTGYVQHACCNEYAYSITSTSAAPSNYLGYYPTTYSYVPETFPSPPSSGPSSPASQFQELLDGYDPSGEEVHSSSVDSSPVLGHVVGGTPSSSKRRFACDVQGCDRLFTSQYTLKVHTAAHRPKASVTWPCTYGCDQDFSRKHDRLRHEVAKHGRVCEYSCEDCGRFFTTTRTYQNHKCRMAPV